MLKRLSEGYQKEIALLLLSVFLFSGLGSLKAQMGAYSRYSSAHTINGFTPEENAPYSNKDSIKTTGVSLSAPGAKRTVRGKSSKGLASALRGLDLVSGSSKKVFGGGPSQPEMTGFKSVGSDNMVSPFTGDFSYNIPLLDVGGYPINIFYNSGITMDQEASWAGLGWNINPGTITRNMRGLPDDFNGTDKITKTQSIRDDKTFGLTAGASIKFAGFPLSSLGASLGLAWNNKLGVSSEAGVNAALSISAKSGSLKTYGLTASAGLNSSSRGGASVSPSISLQKEIGKGNYGNLSGSIGVGYSYSSRLGLSSMHLNMNVSESYKRGEGEKQGSISWGSSSGTLSFAYPSVVPSITKPLSRQNYSLELSGGSEMYGVNGHFKLRGYYSRTYIAPEDKVLTSPAFGMLHLQAAENNKDALLDFNRANDGVYTPNTPTIAMPVYTYDVFSINGEGTGGSFRAYRGDIGHMRDPYVKTKENAFGLGVDLGFGNMVHVGADLNYVYSPTDVGDWTTNNMAASVFAFQKNEGAYEASYFKNPSEKTVPDQNFQNAVGNEDLVRFKMANTASPNPMLLPKLVRYDATKNVLGEKTVGLNETKKLSRDKRTQVISFLSAEETERIGSNRKLYSYNSQGVNESRIIYSANCLMGGIDSFYRNHDVNHATNVAPIQPEVLGGETEAFRHKHHISEIDVLGTDGRKYIYGLPVYNKKQYNVSFSIGADQKKSESKAQYDVGEDNTVGNQKGRDWYMEKEEIPAYTHSYLLTELTSSNYVDITGNGISEDDMGDAVKFNYSKYDDYKWRTPVGEASASYSSGLKTDEKDDKAHYVYGEREAWYLYSVESKNLVARFFAKSDRKDGRPVLDENGSLDGSPGKGMKRLDKISLYSKGDLTKYGDNAKPIKTVRFFHSYKLCKNTPSSNEIGSNIEFGQGKLTLDSIWITYNGATRKPKSRYVFYYPDANNPNYKFDQSDRWGTYKSNADNPGDGLSNETYPYSLQKKGIADRNVAAWSMNKVLLPSGGIINIDYESDSYAYVQNKKAASMCQILGFGISESALPATSELPKLYSSNGVENDKVYIELPHPTASTGLSGKAEFAARYLEDVKQLYLKLAVTMPTGSGLSGLAGEESIPVYADIADYGLISPTIAWIKVKDMGNGHTPMVQTALQFLIRQLPGKAYKGYDLSEESGLKSIVMAMGGMLSSVGSMFNGEVNTLKSNGKCRFVVLRKSFAKLTSPVRNKLGGGHRVKRVVISDNWDKMTGQLKATYGQEYNYTTTELINGKLETISSGVASWEPSIGGDENPHREIMRFMDHNRGGPYDYGSVELPLGEMFYPSPMVGYSRVEILSIHRDTVKNLPTRLVTEFYTNKDFPYKSSCTDLSGEANAKYEPAKIMQLLRIDMMKGIAQSQGFLVETNDMNGKEKSQAVYTATDPLNPISYTENFYNTKKVTDKTFGFKHDFSVINRADGKVSTGVIGRDIEVMTDFRQHRSETITANLSINFDGFIVGFFPVPLTNLLQPVVREGTMYRSAAVLKLVTHYGVLDSVVSINKGSMVSTKNLVFDAETGNPLLTRTQNEHNKPIYNFSYPAHWAYSGMGPAYRNIDAVYKNVRFTHGILSGGGSGIFEVLESGDELYVVAQNNLAQPFTPPCDDPSAITPANYAWNTLDKNPANRIWAVNTTKASAGSAGWVFMDANGNPYNAVDASIRIVRSGKRNLLDQSVAAITSLENPVINGQLSFNEATKIIQTSAATFKDHWRVDNSFYRITETVDSFVYARVKRFELNPISSLSVSYDRHYRDNGDNYETPNRYIENGSSLPTYKHTEYYWAKNKWWEQKVSHNKDHRKNSFLLYSYNNVPANAIIYKGMLSLNAHSNFPSFPASHYPNANHPGMHGASNPQNNASLLGEVSSLNKSWYPTTNSTTNADSWINNYFNNNLSNVSYGKGIIPQPATPWESYLYSTSDNRVNVTLPLLTNTSAILKSQKQVGFKLRLMNDEKNPHDGDTHDYRCYWSPTASVGCSYRMSGEETRTAHSGSCAFAIPKLYYYYYVWGETSTQYNYDNDPSVNTLLTKYVKKVVASYCKSKFDRKAVNPYVEGILGNWRVDSTYAYYGERREADLSLSQIDTRTAGAIKNYKSFWNFASVSGNAGLYLTRHQQAADVWVWNSAVTQYNRKGYEIENTDPLGRFNSGLYGYNQQLPVAIANNARVREILYDGFEDYDYQTAANCISCPPHRAFNYTAAVSQQISSSQKHTGRYSLKVNTGQSIRIQAPIASLEEANKKAGLKIQNSTTSYTNQYLGSSGVAGSGLVANWYNHAVVGSPRLTLEPAPSNTYPQATLISTSSTSLPQVFSNSSLPAGVTKEYFSVKWEGKIQAPATGIYRFKTISDNGCRIKIGGTVLSSAPAWNSQLGSGNGNEVTQSIALIVGQVYPIEVSFYNQWGPYQFDLKWNFSNGTLYNNTTSFFSLPVTYLYNPTATSFQQVITAQQTCFRLDSSQVTGNALTDSFSLIQGRKMLLSAWVKVGEANCCFPLSYDNGSNNITLTFENGNGSTTSLSAFKPTGSIIEGWQRYEAIFDVPGNALSMEVSLNNTGSGSAVYYDDLRLHPFNANMKSYVYHSGNLRLMAELDENNYSSLYEYDDDGTLTRVKKETEMGIKTIKESRSATQKKITE